MCGSSDEKEGLPRLKFTFCSDNPRICVLYFLHLFKKKKKEISPLSSSEPVVSFSDCFVQWEANESRVEMEQSKEQADALPDIFWVL